MLKLSQTISVVLVFLIACNVEAADGVLGSVDSQAEEWFGEFVADRESVPNNFAVVCSAATFAFREKSENIYEQEHWAVVASVGDKKNQIHAFSMSRPNAQEGYWEQSLIEDGVRYLRRGSPFGRGASNSHEDVNVALGDSETRRLTPIFDPYFLPIADGGSFLKSSIKPDFGILLLRKAEFERAEFKEKGLVEAEWSLNKSKTSRMQITFSPKHGNKPVAALWWIEVKDQKGKAFRNIFTAVTTKWHHANFGEGNKRTWVPVEIKRTHFFNGGTSHSDYVFRLEWRTIKESAFPANTDDDWRQPFANLFEVDWHQPWQTFRPYDLEF